MSDWEKVIVLLMSLVIGLVLAFLGILAYYAATGGLHDTRRVEVNSVECVEVYNRLTGNVSDVSCPVVRR